LRIPAELRNQIYEYVLGGMCLEADYRQTYTTGHRIKVQPMPYEPRQGKEVVRLLALTETCRQIRSETRLLPFALNEFCGSTIKIFCVFVTSLSEEQRRIIRRIRLPVYHKAELDMLPDRLNCTWSRGYSVTKDKELVVRAIVTSMAGVKHLLLEDWSKGAFWQYPGHGSTFTVEGVRVGIIKRNYRRR